MRPLMLKLACATIIATTAPHPTAADGWPGCWRADDCQPIALNVAVRQGNARVSVGRACFASRIHDWGINDAHGALQQWLNDNAANGVGHVCIRLPHDADEVRITSSGGHCGETDTVPEMASASEPGPDVTLRRSYPGPSSAVLAGCHATIGTGDDEVAYGGIALNFSDGFGFGDSYAKDIFYGVYDGFGAERVRPFGATVRAIADFNTFHYRVEVLARGRAVPAIASQED